jgi:hypothetical protein
LKAIGNLTTPISALRSSRDAQLLAFASNSQRDQMRCVCRVFYFPNLHKLHGSYPQIHHPSCTAFANQFVRVNDKIRHRRRRRCTYEFRCWRVDYDRDWCWRWQLSRWRLRLRLRTVRDVRGRRCRTSRCLGRRWSLVLRHGVPDARVGGNPRMWASVGDSGRAYPLLMRLRTARQDTKRSGLPLPTHCLGTGWYPIGRRLQASLSSSANPSLLAATRRPRGGSRRRRGGFFAAFSALGTALNAGAS